MLIARIAESLAGEDQRFRVRPSCTAILKCLVPVVTAHEAYSEEMLLTSLRTLNVLCQDQPQHQEEVSQTKDAVPSLLKLARSHTDFMVKVLAAKIYVTVSHSRDWTIEVKYLMMQMVSSLPREVNLEKTQEVDRVILACSVI